MPSEIGQRSGGCRAGAGTVRRGRLVLAQISKRGQRDLQHLDSAAAVENVGARSPLVRKITAEPSAGQSCRDVTVLLGLLFMLKKDWLINWQVIRFRERHVLNGREKAESTQVS